jgi:DNA-binding response OmpR family regulator
MMPVLVVEDDPQLRTLLGVVLQRAGVEVELAARGDDGLRAISSRAHDAILLDLMLPGLNGVEILRAVRASHSEVLPRIIVLTAVAEAALRDFEFESAVWKVMRKPFDLQELREVLFACIAFHRAKA